MIRLRWSGSQEAQRQADAAWAKVRPHKKPKRKKKPKAKALAYDRTTKLDELSVEYLAIVGKVAT
jgi:hypothetical protein